MTDSRSRRHRAIAELIRSGTIASQEALADKLGELGFAVTQATVSRDLEQLGACASPEASPRCSLPDRAG